MHVVGPNTLQNSSLEQSCCQLKEDQEKILLEKERLLAEQQGLQDRLKKALELHLHPKTSVDTATIAEKIVFMFDDILQGKPVEMSDVLELRNSANDAIDLRQPINLQEQIMNKSGLSQDVGASMMEMLQGDSNSSAKRWASSTLSKRTASRLGGRNGSRRSSIDVLPGLHRIGSSLPSETSRLLSSTGEHGDDQEALGAAEQVDRPLTPEVEQLLQAASDTSNFGFDMFQLAEASGNRPLSMLAFFLFSESGLTQMYSLPENKLLMFLHHLEDGYPANPYHNRTHAASVLQMMHVLMHNGLIEQGILDGITMLACYMAACIHDYDHQGVNNDFLIKTRDSLAILYNDASPNENHHVSGACSLGLSSPALNYVENLAAEDKNILRASIIELVLATDMKKHFGLISLFQVLPRPSTAQSLSGLPMMDECGPLQSSPSSLSTQQKMLIAQVALKCADLGHLTAPHEVHRRWVDALTEEFFRQGDQERKKGMKISPLMDRNETAGMIKSQVGFLEIVALPLFKSFVEQMPAAQPMLDAVKANYKYWHGVHHIHNADHEQITS
ncbi:hypothetical protein WJX84_003967 [Apatococcus fuscideae]|uniref:Phosphodiesterase n=1 Tax=Apatococcus fuscideae TaxID=2026836 RepID=A0AAW1SQC0_9CHLO